MNDNSQIRIGIVGAGGIVQRRHLPGLRAISGVEVVVVCNRRRETAEEVARTFGIPEVADDWVDVVTRPDLDAIWIGTTPHLHAPISVAALEQGKHVFCQARMAMNLAEARSMLAAAQAHPSLVAMLCPPPNGMKHGRYFEELLQGMRIGRLLHFDLRSLSAMWADPTACAHWRQQTELSGNNILSVGIYGEVLGRWFGQPEEVCAQAQVSFPDRAGYVVKVPDAVQVLGKWPQELQGILEWSGVVQGSATDLLRVHGTDGTLSYDFQTDEIQLCNRGEGCPSPVVVPPDHTGTWNVEAEFIHALRHGHQPEPSFLTGVKYMAFVEAVNLSIRNHQWTDVTSL